MARGVFTRSTSTRPSRHSPDEHLPTHEYYSLLTGDDPLGHAWILPDLPLGQAPFLAEPGGDMVFGLDPRGLEASLRDQRHDDHDGHDAHASRAFLWEDWRRVAGSPPRVRCRGPGGRSWDQAS